MTRVIVSGSFDDLRSRQIRLLEEASRFGQVQVLLWPDEAVRAIEGQCKFALDERLYLVQAIRYVHQVTVAREPVDPDALGDIPAPDVWIVDEAGDTPRRRAYCQLHRLGYRVIPSDALTRFPPAQFDPAQLDPAHRRVIVTGCYDWFHSGHVRFFEEVSHLGDLYVVVGHDENVRLLKGEGHPFFPQDERRYLVQAVRHVRQSLVSTGHGWMDAEPEIEIVKPHLYAVNEDGDKPDKREFCAAHGLEYVVLRRTPKEGLPERTSTSLRGF
jgi:cytidyltransferase-like protein